MVQIKEAVRTENNSERRPSLKYMLATRSNRRRLLISGLTAVAAQWSGNTVVSYYLVLVLNGIGIKDATHQSLINGGLQIFNLIATVGFGAMLVDKLGRRFLFQWSAIGMTASYVVCNCLPQIDILTSAPLPMYFHSLTLARSGQSSIPDSPQLAPKDMASQSFHYFSSSTSTTTLL